MNRLLYEKSISDNGHLIIPFVFSTVNSQTIYSYKLLSALVHKGTFHKAENPAGFYSNSIEGIFDVAQEHLNAHSDVFSPVDYFKCRYTYRYNLIIVYEESGKYFYDHYKSDSLNNVAAPKLFQSKDDCLRWIKAGLDRYPASEEAATI
ncbi:MULTISPECIES: hypothetical protein [unclassified Coleofasciculus]|uniref:hypothetical protein n=1 Tax=unclassified Coleofasciculus TaxID=2692782 RepID=UPI001882AF73|nr:MULTISPECIES: hypothetical protein [unclassified Coleofasciculus]MBE9128413.1 hypothetical protein [Coleofasciculus sp. LEGE 07081]MBE9149542.1 hypothetical protein [Coleofasciculus sp. LEGE 07092]